MKILPCIISFSILGGLFAADPVNIQVVSPLPVQEALKWDYYVQMFSLKDASVVLDTKNSAASFQVLHSYSIVSINEKPYVLVTFMRPRENFTKVVEEQLHLEDIEIKLRELRITKDPKVKVNK